MSILVTPEIHEIMEATKLLYEALKLNKEEKLQKIHGRAEFRTEIDFRHKIT